MLAQGDPGRGGLAAEPPKNDLHRAGVLAEDVVVEPLGELERGAGVRETARETHRPGEPAVDGRLERGPCRRLAERLFEQRDRTVGALQLGEEDERVGAQSAQRRIVQQLGGDRPRARPLARVAMRMGCRQRTAMTLAVRGRRGQPHGVLRELGGDRRRAAPAGEGCGVVEEPATSASGVSFDSAR